MDKSVVKPIIPLLPYMEERCMGNNRTEEGSFDGVMSSLGKKFWPRAGNVLRGWRWVSRSRRESTRHQEVISWFNLWGTKTASWRSTYSREANLCLVGNLFKWETHILNACLRTSPLNQTVLVHNFTAFLGLIASQVREDENPWQVKSSTIQWKESAGESILAKELWSGEYAMPEHSQF